MVCACCGKPKKVLEPRKSRLMQNASLLLCESCRTKQHEPRHIVILTAHVDSLDKVKDYLKKSRYCGEDILARELTD